jgi:CRISPR-associated endonuclease Csn1
LRVINKTTNKYQVYENGKKILKLQEKGDSWAIRKPLHKEFVFGKVNLPRIKVPKGKIIVAIRRSLDTTFDLKKIDAITDTGIQKILKNYLASKDNDPNSAFSHEGIEEMNQNIKLYNDGKYHQPIHKVRTFEIGNRFSLCFRGNKKDKYVESADGTNLFFAIYIDENEKRWYEIIPLNIAVERLKQGLKEVPEKKIIEVTNENGKVQAKEIPLLFSLSPDDLVYIPEENEKNHIHLIDFNNLNQKQRLWVVNDFSSTIYFRPCSFAKSIAPKEVDLSFNNKKNKLQGSFDHKTASFEGEQIKDVCIKLKIDRLGNITEVNGKKFIQNKQS